MRSRRFRILGGACLAVLGGGLLFVACWREAGQDPMEQARSAYSRGEWDRAAAAARTLLRAKPKDSDGLKLLARTAARQGRDEAAEALYRRLGSQALEAEDLHLLARGLLRRGQRGPARPMLELARNLAPDDPELLETLLDYELEGGALIQAAADAERLRLQPGWEVRGAVALGQVWHRLMDPAGAAALIGEALRRDPALAACAISPRDARLLLATCWLELGRPKEARIELESILAAGPDPEASWLLSRAHLMSGSSPEAIAAARDAGTDRASDPMRPEPSPFVGAARCEPCHPREFRWQSHSRHSQTLIHGSALKDLPWPASPLADDSAGTSHSFARTAEGVEVRTRHEQRIYTALVAYAMGSNHQGRTFVGREANGQMRELRISQYPCEPVWARTMNHPATPEEPTDSVGRPIDADAVRKCVHCHATSFRAIQNPQGRPEAADRGIGCERCHGPGGHHLAAVEAGFPDPAIARPRLASAEQVTSLCGQCHSANGAIGSSQPAAIRFQAPSFVQSRCYLESGTFSCVTCHNPHRDAGRNPSEYEAICLNCHPASATGAEVSAVGTGPAKTWAPCPVRPQGDCLGCHMPRLPNAVPRAVFTDHFIRVRGPERPR